MCKHNYASILRLVCNIVVRPSIDRIALSSRLVLNAVPVFQCAAIIITASLLQHNGRLCIILVNRALHIPHADCSVAVHGGGGV